MHTWSVIATLPHLRSWSKNRNLLVNPTFDACNSITHIYNKHKNLVSNMGINLNHLDTERSFNKAELNIEADQTNQPNQPDQIKYHISKYKLTLNRIASITKAGPIRTNLSLLDGSDCGGGKTGQWWNELAGSLNDSRRALGWSGDKLGSPVEREAGVRWVLWWLGWRRLMYDGGWLVVAPEVEERARRWVVGRLGSWVLGCALESIPFCIVLLL